MDVEPGGLDEGIAPVEKRLPESQVSGGRHPEKQPIRLKPQAKGLGFGTLPTRTPDGFRPHFRVWPDPASRSWYWEWRCRDGRRIGMQKWTAGSVSVNARIEKRELT
jgi:hypothetical protein